MNSEGRIANSESSVRCADQNQSRDRKGVPSNAPTAPAILSLVPIALLVIFPTCIQDHLKLEESPEFQKLVQDQILASRIPVTQPSDSGFFLVMKDGECIDGHGKLELIGGDTVEMPDQFTGRAIVVRNAKNVTIRNGKITGFKVAIYAENCPNLTVENCDVSNNYRQHLKSTPQKEDESDWLYGHENDKNEWLSYGAGIYLYKCDGATIKNCRARDGQNGICLVNCDNAKVIGNDMSFMSGWGLAMWRSCKAQIIGNRFDYCIRGYSHGVYARGQDSTGILVYEQCSDNVFAYNHATHGGDGFFLYAGNETVNKTGEGGCNRNLVYMNDYSHAVANGIEATFSDRNEFIRNKLTHCEHGFWGGYSSHTIIGANRISNCTNGVSIEHGRNNQLTLNQIEHCKKGVWIWWDDDKELLASPYAKKQGAGCENENLHANYVDVCEVGLYADSADKLQLGGNRFNKCSVIIKLKGTTTVLGGGNEKNGGVIENDTPSAATKDELPRDIWFINDSRPWNPAKFWPPPSDEDPPRLGTQPLEPLPGIPEGKEHVVIDEWGPKIKQ